MCISCPKHSVLTRYRRFLANSPASWTSPPRSNTPWPEVCYHTANQRALGASWPCSARRRAMKPWAAGVTRVIIDVRIGTGSSVAPIRARPQEIPRCAVERRGTAADSSAHALRNSSSTSIWRRTRATGWVPDGERQRHPPARFAQCSADAPNRARGMASDLKLPPSSAARKPPAPKIRPQGVASLRVSKRLFRSCVE